METINYNPSDFDWPGFHFDASLIEESVNEQINRQLPVIMRESTKDLDISANIQEENGQLIVYTYAGAHRGFFSDDSCFAASMPKIELKEWLITQYRENMGWNGDDTNSTHLAIKFLDVISDVLNEINIDLPDGRDTKWTTLTMLIPSGSRVIEEFDGKKRVEVYNTGELMLSWEPASLISQSYSSSDGDDETRHEITVAVLQRTVFTDNRKSA